MKEIDFEFIIKYLEMEIARLTSATNMVMQGEIQPDIVCSATEGMVEYLSNLLSWIKSAVRVERDKIQGAQDRIDATMYALLSKSNIKLDPSLTREITSKECELMASKVEDIRLALKSRRADTTSEKIKFVRQDEVLSKASDMLTKISEEKSKTR